MFFKRLILTLTAFLLLIGFSSGQSKKKFPEDPNAFISDLPLFFESISNEDAWAETFLLLDTLSADWTAGRFSDDEKIEIIQLSNALLKRRLPAYPHFYRFFYNIMELHLQEGKQSFVLPWLESIEDFMKEASLRQIQGHIGTYFMFFTENILYSSSSIQWYLSDSLYRFEYDTIPVFYLKKTDLLCATKKDTSVISGTEGAYFPTLNFWKGFNGTVNWERVGYPKDTVFARLNDYEIKLKHSYYNADSVVFYNKNFFKEPILGAFQEKVLSSRAKESAPYPQFQSYLKNFQINNIFKDIDYEGGFSMRGRKLIGSGNVKNNAYLFVKITENKNITIRSHAFFFEEDAILANPATVNISFGEDSIYHPSLNLRYNDNTRILELLRSGEGLYQSPFFNTFHRVEMYVGSMRWEMDENIINFEKVIGVQKLGVADFISGNYFSKYSFDKLQGIDKKNPLYVIRDFFRIYGTREVSPAILSQYMKKPLEQVKATLIKLSDQGFFYYDIARDKAIIEDRLFDYIRANLGEIDYDVIHIHSETEDSSNAILFIDNMDLLIRGVSEVFLSDSQNVYIYPEKKEIVLKKNRDFVFTGSVRAGLFEFYAHECSFEYDPFRLNMPTIDSLSFHVKSFKKNKNGEYEFVKVRTVIEGLSGALLIDEPNNKSGLKNFAQYPLFISEQESFVYYDKDSVYNRDNFKYYIAPFKLESLDNFSTDGLEFSGYLASDDIFPEIEQPLKVQPDYSLGFIKDTPDEGYPVYGGKGRFYTTLDLSNLGLRARGTLEYMTSTTACQDFHFYPDSLTAQGITGFFIDELKGAVEYPDVSIDSANLIWYPSSDTMKIRMIDKPFRMFNDKSDLYGDLVLTDKGLSGSGSVNFESSGMDSREFRFGQHTITADTLDFRLYTKGGDSLALSAQNYQAKLDFEKRIVEFHTNKAGSVMRFPYHNFISSMQTIDWHMDNNELTLANDVSDITSGIDSLSIYEMMDLDLSGSEFVSTNPGQDSLKFFAGHARYNMTDYIIYAEGVMFIKIADAAIFPSGGYVTILKGGKIEEMENARIVANTDTKNFTINNATVNVISRNNYEGRGIYPYVDYEKFIQDIKLSEIYVDSTGVTRGRGLVREADNFMLSPEFAFTGNVFLQADKKFLRFEGGYKIRENCLKSYQQHWAFFDTLIDPHHVVLPVPEDLHDIDGIDIDAALYFSGIYDHIYPVLFTQRKILSDTAIYYASGEISYDTVRKEYIISPVVMQDGSAPGNSLTFSTRKCSIEGSGPLNLGLDMGYVDIQSVGDIQYLIIPDSTRLRGALAIDFYFDETALSMLADSMIMSDLPGLDVTSAFYDKIITFFLGQEKTEDIKTDASLFGVSRKIPEELVHTFFLPDVKLYWNSITRSYMSKGPFAVANIGKIPVNRYVDGFIELVKKRSGDEMNLYIEVTDRLWYYFNYKNNILQTISSDMPYNVRITDLKSDRRIYKDNDQEEQYEYVISGRRKRIDFLRKMDEYNK